MLTSNNGDTYIGHDRYLVLEMLGYGANGTIYLSKDISNGELVAIKELKRNDLNPRERKIQDLEAYFHQILSESNHVVNLYDTVEDEDALYLVMEFCEHGDLFEFVVRQTVQQRLDNIQLNKKLIKQVILAVIDCHNKGIYHRDLKPENCMLSGDGFEVRLGDFGLSTDEIISNDYGCGSACYMSPECNILSQDKGHGFNTIKNDVWSLGIIMINVMCGLNPWKQACIEDEAFVAYLRNPLYLYETLGISHDFYLILKDVLQIDPENRISLEELLYRVENCTHFLKLQPLDENVATTNNTTQLKAPLSISIDSASLSNFEDEVYYSDSCHSLSSPTNPIFDLLPGEPRFDKDNMLAMYFDEGIGSSSAGNNHHSYIDLIESDY